MLVFARRRTAKQLLFLSPRLPSKVAENGSCKEREKCHPTGHRPQTVRQPLLGLGPKSHGAAMGHGDSNGPSTVTGTVTTPGPSLRHPQLTQTLSSKTNHTRKARLVRCTHTHVCVCRRANAGKKKKKSMLNKLIKQAEFWPIVFIHYFPGSCHPQAFSLHDFRLSLLFPHFTEVLYFPKGSFLNSQVNSLGLLQQTPPPGRTAQV